MTDSLGILPRSDQVGVSEDVRRLEAELQRVREECLQLRHVLHVLVLQAGGSVSIADSAWSVVSGVLSVSHDPETVTTLIRIAHYRDRDGP